MTTNPTLSAEAQQIIDQFGEALLSAQAVAIYQRRAMPARYDISTVNFDLEMFMPSIGYVSRTDEQTANEVVVWLREHRPELFSAEWHDLNEVLREKLLTSDLLPNEWKTHEFMDSHQVEFRYLAPSIARPVAEAPATFTHYLRVAVTFPEDFDGEEDINTVRQRIERELEKIAAECVGVSYQVEPFYPEMESYEDYDEGLMFMLASLSENQTIMTSQQGTQVRQTGELIQLLKQIATILERRLG